MSRNMARETVKPMLVVLAWFVAGPALGQEPPPPATQPSVAPATRPAGRLPTRRTSRTSTQPSAATQPAAVITPEGQPPATQEARDNNLQRYNAMRAASRASQGTPADAPDGQASGQETESEPSSQPADGTETAPAGRRLPRPTPEEMQRNRERARQSALERARNQAHQQVPDAAGSAPAGTMPSSPESPDEQPPAETAPAAPASPNEVVPRNTGRTVRPHRGGRDVRPATPAQPADGDQEGVEPSPNPDGTPGEARPVEPPPVDDGRTEWFNFKDMPWEDVVKQIAERIGKPLMANDVIVSGTLTYENSRRFTKEEALDELNFLLAQQGYFIQETEFYVYVVPLNEASKFLEEKYIFPTIESFNAAQLRDMQLCQVFIKISEYPAEKIRDLLAPSMPDHALPVAVADTNQIKITGMARDIRRFEALRALIDPAKFDPRQMRIFSVKTNVQVVERMVRDLLDVAQPQRRFNQQTRQWEMSGGESDVKILSDDRTNTLIVKATPQQLDEVADLIERFGTVKDIGEFKTTVVPVENGDASDIARLLNEIFQQEQGQSRTPVRPTFRGRPQPGQPQPQPNQQVSPEDIIVEDIYERAKKTVRLVADDRTNSLIVYANEDGLKRVQEMLEIIDKPVPSNFRTFKLDHAKAEQIHPIIEQIARGISQSAGGGGRQNRAPSVVLDQPNNALHVIAEREEMERISDMITQLDIEATADQQHVVELVNLKPSQIAQTIQALLTSTANTAGPTRPGRQGVSRRGGAGVGVGGAGPSVVPMDEAQLLIVVCSEDDWDKVKDTIALWDSRALTNQPETRFFTVENGNPDTIAETLNTLFRNYSHPSLGRTQVFIQAVGNEIVTYGIKPALDEIASLLPKVDVAINGNPLVIIPLQNADATVVAQYAQQQIGAPSRGGRGGGRQTATVQADAPTNSILVVGASKQEVEQIKGFVQEYEQKLATQSPEKRTYTIQYVDANEVLNALTQFFTATAGNPRGGRGGQVKAVRTGNSIIVEAPAEKFAEIEDMVRKIDIAPGQLVTEVVRTQGQDPAGMAQMLQQHFNKRPPRPDRLTYTFTPDANNATVVLTMPKDSLPEAHELIEKYMTESADSQLVEKFIDVQFADANYVGEQLKAMLSARSQGGGRGQASRINVVIDARLNRVAIYAPQSMMEMAESLVAQIDKPYGGGARVQSIALMNTDATVVAQKITELFAEKLRTVRTLKISPEPISGTILVAGANKEDFEEIQALAKRLDESMADADTQPVTLDLKFADPAETANMINNLFGAGKRGGSSQAGPKVTVTVANNTLIVKAPAKELDAIKALVAKIDAENPNELQVKIFPLKVLKAAEVATQVNLFLAGSALNTKRGEMKPAAFGETNTNTLVVLAPADKLPFIEGLISQFESQELPTAEPRAYTFANVKPEQVAPNIEAMLQAKVMEKEGPKQTRVQVKAVALPGSNQLFVYAPEEYQELAGTLVKLIDKEVDTGEIVHIIQLEQADAGQLAQTLNTQMQGAAKRGGTPPVTVVADSGSNSIVLKGLPKDVAELEGLTRELETNSSSVPELQVFKIENTSVLKAAEALQEIFKTARTPADVVTVSEDEFYSTLTVTANRRKMRIVEEMVKQIDAPKEMGEGELPGNKELHFVTIGRGDPWDIATDVEDYFPLPEDGGPTIEAPLFGDYIKVICRPGEYDRIEALIRKHEARAKPEVSYVVRRPKADLSRLMPLIQVQFPNATVEKGEEGPKRPPTLVEELWGPDETPPGVNKRAEPREEPDRTAPRDDSNRVLPDEPARSGRQGVNAQRKHAPGLQASPFLLSGAKLNAWLDEVEAGLDSFRSVGPRGRTPKAAEAAQGSTDPQRPTSPRPGTASDSGVRRYAGLAEVQGYTRLAAQEEPEPPARATTRSAPPAANPQPKPVAAEPPPPAIEGPKITILPDGRIAITGDKTRVEDIDEALDLLEEDLAVGEVIRIFKFKYGDVAVAARILELMFNETPAARNMAQLQQMQQMQAQMRQQQQQQQQNRDGKDEKGGGGLMDQVRSMMGGQQQKGGAQQQGQRMRIATDVSHNYLIVKCDEADLPEIRQLLREMDIPAANIDIEVFQLKNIDATETANNLKDVLGINKARGGRQAGPQAMPRAGGAQQAQLLELMQQQMVAVGGAGGEGGEGVKVESVEIVPNALTNSLLVSAPPDVMKIIHRLVDGLEELEGRDVVVIRHYPLKNAKLEQVLPLLQEVFEATSGAAAKGGRKSASPADLGPVTVSGDTRNNTVIYTAQQKDIAAVERQIESLDIEGDFAEAETFVLKYGDAAKIAQTVQDLFSGGGGGGGRPGADRAGPLPGGPEKIVITSEPLTNTIIVRASKDKRDEVFAKVEELDELSRRDIKEITVLYADPEKLAEKLRSIFGGVGGDGGRAGRGGGAADPSRVSGPLVIIGDKISKKILVRAPEAVYHQMNDLVAALDKADPGLQVKSFPLKYADAQIVVDSVKNAMMEFMAVKRQAGGQDMDFDAFTAVADPRTNSVMVVGSQQTFAFVGEVLAIVDQDTPVEKRKQFRVFVLDKSDATTVADAINAFASGQAAAGGERGARRGGGLPGPLGGGGGGLSAAPLLDVQAVAEPATNSVLVFGKTDDIDTVETTVIAKLEDALSQHRQFETIAVEQAVPSELLGFLQPQLDMMAGPTGGPGGRDSGGAMRAPLIIPNDNAGTIEVRGSKAQIRELQELVQRFDNKDLVSTQVQIVPLPPGQDAAVLAQTVERVFNEGERRTAQKFGRQPREVTIAADDYTNSLLIYGDPAQYGAVKTLVGQLGEIRSSAPITRVIELRNLSATDAQSLVEDLQRRRGASSGGRNTIRPAGGGSAPGPGLRRPSSPPMGPPQVAPSSPSAPEREPRRSERPRGNQPGRGSSGDRPSGNRPSRNPRPANPPSGGGQAPFDSEASLGRAGSARLLSDSEAILCAANAFEAEWRAEPALPIGRGGAGLIALFLQDAEQPADDETTAQPPRGELVESTPTATAPGATLPSVSGQLQGEVMATPLDSKRIIITGDQEDVEFIEQMLLLMEASTPQAQIEVFSLTYAKAPAIQPVLEQTVRAIIEARGGSTDRLDRFSIIAEGRSNSLIVTASATNMDLIEEMIHKLDVDTGVSGAPKLVPLHNIRADEAVNLLKPIIQRLNGMRQVPGEAQAEVTAEPRTNSVFVVGTPADINEIERMIEAIDVELPPAESFTTGRVMIIDLTNAQADDLSETLNTLIEADRSGGGGTTGGASRSGNIVRKLLLTGPDGQELPPLDLDRPIRILPDAAKNSLIIYSSEKNNEALAQIVKVFDTLPQGAEIDVKSFALEHADAQTVADMLTKMFDEAKKAMVRPTDLSGSGKEPGKMLPQPEGLAAAGLPYNVSISADPRSNSVFVVGRKPSVLLAAGIVTELDKPGTELGLKPHVLRLQNLAASNFQETLQEMLDKRAESLGGNEAAKRDNAVIMLDDRSNALVVLSSDDTWHMVSDLARQLDDANAYRTVDSQFRRLKYADAAKLASMLQELFDKKKEAVESSREGGKQQDVLFVQADNRSNSLMITGTRDYISEAEGLIDKLDQAFDPTVEFKVRPVLLNSATNLASLLQEMVDKSVSGQGDEMKGSPIHISADAYSNTLLMAASHEDMTRLQTWVDRLDVPPQPGRITRIIPVRTANAEDIAKSAGDLFKPSGGGASGGGGGQDVTVTFDATTNSVVAVGPPQVVQDIADFVSKLDQTQPVGGTVVRIFKLEQADAEDSGDLLRNILEGRGGSVGGTRGGGGTSTGGGSREEAAAQIMLIFQKTHPEMGTETLKAMRKDVVVIDDLRTNSLVVTAPPESMALVESLIAAIDVPPDAAKIRVFELRNSDSEEMVTMLQELIPSSTRSGGGSTTGGGASGDQERVLTLEGSTGEGGRQELTFTTDKRTNSVIAAGTKGYLDLVENLILDLDSKPIQDRKTRVIWPRNTDAVKLQEMIKNYSDADMQALQDLGAEVSASVKQQRNILAIASEDTNRIILDYDPRREQDVLDLVRELDQQPPQVMIQVLIVEVTMSNSLELGVEFAFQDLQFTKAGPQDTTTFDYVGGTDIGAAGTGLGGFTFTITGQDFNFLIRTLQSEGTLNVLSRPQIVAMDNQDAKIEITNDVPYPTGSTAVGGQVTTSVGRQDVGIILEVTPHINPDGFVRMEIKQEVSDLTDSTVAVAPGVNAPVFFKRNAETVVTVKDSETVVLGGLITSRDNVTEQKVPILGDIPILGILFRNDVRSSDRTELLVILTPRVVRTIEDYRELSARERDNITVLPDETLTNPLMQGLRVAPEDLIETPEGKPAGPTATQPAPEDRPIDTDIYGPVRSTPSNPQQPDGSYDVPVSMATGGRNGR